MQMALKDDLTDSVDGILGTAFQERDGKKIPTSADIALSNGAVKLARLIHQKCPEGLAGVA